MNLLGAFDISGNHPLCAQKPTLILLPLAPFFSTQDGELAPLGSCNREERRHRHTVYRARAQYSPPSGPYESVRI